MKEYYRLLKKFIIRNNLQAKTKLYLCYLIIAFFALTNKIEMSLLCTFLLLKF